MEPQQAGDKAAAQLRWLRDEERHEIAWVGHRLGWMLLAQSFLITAAIMGQSKAYPWWCGTVVTFILGCLGTWLSIRSGLAIKAAQSVTHAWLMREQHLCMTRNPELRTYRLFRPMHEGRPLEEDRLHTVAIKLHTGIHIAFIVTWIALFFGARTAGLQRLEAEDNRLSLSLADGSQTTKGNAFSEITFNAFGIAAALLFFMTFPDWLAVRKAAKKLEGLHKKELESTEAEISTGAPMRPPDRHTTMETTKPTPFERYEVLRDEFHKEHQLVSNRTTWFAISQSFLISAIVLGNERMGVVTDWIPYIGFFISLFSFLSIIAALIAMHDLKDQHDELDAANPNLKDLPVCGRKAFLHWLGMAPPFFLPVIFLALWTASIRQGLTKWHNPETHIPGRFQMHQGTGAQAGELFILDTQSGELRKINEQDVKLRSKGP